MDDFSEPVADNEEISSERAMHHLKCMGRDCGWRADEVEIYVSRLELQIENFQRMVKGLADFAGTNHAQMQNLQNKVRFFEAVIERAWQAKDHTLCLDELEKARMQFGSQFMMESNDAK